MDVIIFQSIFDGIGLSPSDVLITIIGGIITGVSAMLVYKLQKKIEHNSNKYSSTSILYEEITRNARLGDFGK